MTMIKLLRYGAVAAIAMMPAIAHSSTKHLSNGERKAALAAGCTLNHFPNPTGKIVTPPPRLHCSPEARIAFEKATQAQMASATAGKASRAE